MYIFFQRDVCFLGLDGIISSTRITYGTCLESTIFSFLMGHFPLVLDGTLSSTRITYGHTCSASTIFSFLMGSFSKLGSHMWIFLQRAQFSRSWWDTFLNKDHICTYLFREHGLRARFSCLDGTLSSTKRHFPQLRSHMHILAPRARFSCLDGALSSTRITYAHTCSESTIFHVVGCGTRLIPTCHPPSCGRIHGRSHGRKWMASYHRRFDPCGARYWAVPVRTWWEHPHFNKNLMMQQTTCSSASSWLTTHLNHTVIDACTTALLQMSSR